MAPVVPAATAERSGRENGNRMKPTARDVIGAGLLTLTLVVLVVLIVLAGL